MTEKLNNSEIKRIVEFVSEAGMLKNISRSGWKVLGIKSGESVADHSYRCATLSYILAMMEGVSPYKPLFMGLFNDIQETRITDLHKMAQRYINYKNAEEKSFYEQIEKLPLFLKEELSNLHKEYISQKSKESIIARDADILECLIQAKEYYEQGYKQASKFMKKAPKHLKTKSAKQLWKTAKETDFNQWWYKVSDFER